MPKLKKLSGEDDIHYRAFTDEEKDKVFIAYKQLMRLSGKVFSLKFTKHPHTPAAFYRGNRIIADSNLVKQPLEVITFVLAHEWGHLMHRHGPEPKHPILKQQREDQADIYACRVMARLGYNITPVYHFNQELDLRASFRRNNLIHYHYNQSLHKLSYKGTMRQHGFFYKEKQAECSTANPPDEVAPKVTEPQPKA